jgi:mRNA-degrading endonuclease RelE of RelBE toxin-antitoxin system
VAFAIILAPAAAAALKNLPVPIRTGVKKALDVHLTHEPTKVSKSRIKRLQGMSQPQYRLRVGDIRVFYDVTETQVQVLAVVTKAEAQSWLDDQGTPTQRRQRELERALLELRTQLNRWQRGEITGADLNDLIHQYHQGPAREIRKRVRGGSGAELVAKGLGHWAGCRMYSGVSL